jgi:hypothetical protein
MTLCSQDPDSFLTCRGSPRYREGKLESVFYYERKLRSIWSHLIGYSWVFSILVSKPLALAKMSRMKCVTYKSSA